MSKLPAHVCHQGTRSFTESHQRGFPVVGQQFTCVGRGCAWVVWLCCILKNQFICVGAYTCYSQRSHKQRFEDNYPSSRCPTPLPVLNSSDWHLLSHLVNPTLFVLSFFSLLFFKAFLIASPSPLSWWRPPGYHPTLTHQSFFFSSFVVLGLQLVPHSWSLGG